MQDNAPDKTPDNIPADESPDTVCYADVSAALREARESCGISIDEVVHELNLSRDSILALEEGDFEKLGAPVFVKGHLRNYARLLELDEQRIVDAFVTPEQPAEEFRTLSKPKVVRQGASMSGVAMWAAAGIVVLVGSVYLLSGDSSDDATDDPRDSSVSQPADAAVLTEEQPSSGDVARIEEQPEVDAIAPAAEGSTESPVEEVFVGTADNALVAEAGREPVPEPAAPVVEEPASAPPEVAQEVVAEPAGQAAQAEAQAFSLTLSFSDDCWVEIRDSRRQLSFGLQTSGKVLTLQAVPPVSFLLGNAAAVEMAVGGESFAIPRNPRSRSKAARFELTEDSLQ